SLASISIAFLSFFVFLCPLFCLFFFTVTATTEIYTLSLHDALPISPRVAGPRRASLRAQRALRLIVRHPLRCTGHQSSSERSNRSEEHTSELQSPYDLVCRLLLEKKKKLLMN